MKKSKFTEQQIAFALRQAETGTKAKEVIRQLGITEQTFYRWKRPTWSGFAPIQVGLTECPLSDIAENAVYSSYQRPSYAQVHIARPARPLSNSHAGENRDPLAWAIARIQARIPYCRARIACSLLILAE